MPYLPESQRRYVVEYGAKIPGQLNYALTREVQDYLKRTAGDVPTYADYNAVVGVLECAKLEFYRRAMAAYEDEKIAQNGDVY